jgi:hypothetical protein
MTGPYFGNIPARGIWKLIAYSPEVGVVVTCETAFGDNGLMTFYTKYPDSVRNGMTGQCP